MNTREKYSVALVSLGLILSLIPLSGNRSLTVKPQKLLTEVNDEKLSFTADQVARFIVTEDSTVQIIDLRSPEEFNSFNIPGSINVPYKTFLNSDPGLFLNNPDITNILYSNGDINSNYALVLARGMNYNNVFTMEGGLNEWFNTVMNSSFSGERITARENALFETRTRAKKIFFEINSLPDSLKQQFMLAKKAEVKKLDGGCE